MAKDTKKAKSKKRISRPKLNLSVFKNKDFFIHLIASLSLVPMAIALWVAFPTFQIESSDKIYKFGAIQLFEETNPDTGETIVTNRVGFDESFDLQSGVSFNFEIVKEEKPLEAESLEGEVVPTVEPTIVENTSPTPTPTPEFIDPSQEDFDKTISIIRTRLDSLDAVENQVFKYTNDSNYGAIINMSSSREDAGIIPYYLSLKGEDIQIWVDDPNYQPSETSSFSLMDGLIPSGLDKEDIAFVQVVNDEKTYGNGLRLVFKKSSFDEFFNAASQITQRGFALVIDGQPIAYQSYPINLQQQDTGIVYLTNPFGASDRESYAAVASVINNEPLPLSVTVVTNNNTDSFIEIDIARTKLSLFIAFILINIILFVVFKSKSILVSAVGINTLVITIAAYKIFGLPLNMNLIWGTMIGVILMMMMALVLVRELTNGMHKTIDSMKDVSKTYRDNFRNIIIVILIIASIIEIFDVTFVYQLQLGIGISLLAGLITVWTVMRAFVNELFILPVQSDVKKR